MINGGQQPPAQAPEGRRAGLGVEIAQFLERHRGERHAIVLHDFPDPDAIASAYTHGVLSAAYGIETTSLYGGRVSHQQNVALVKLLGIDLVRFEPGMDLSHYDGAVFVDNQGTSAEALVEALEAADVPALLVVDHHEPQDRLTPELSDVRRSGATSSLYAEYLEKGLVNLDKTRREHVVAATALTHGIMSDTNNFVQADARDFEAAAFLSRFRDSELLAQILSQARTKQVMEIIHRALGDRVIAESYSLAGIGYVRMEDRDAIPQAADFLLTEENVHTAIVYGILTGEDREERVIGSLRTSKLTIDPDGFIKEVFGKSVEGRYFGGGKQSAGGFDIPVGFLAGAHSEEYRALKWQTYDSQIKHKIFAKIGVEQKQARG